MSHEEIGIVMFITTATISLQFRLNINFKRMYTLGSVLSFVTYQVGK